MMLSIAQTSRRSPCVIKAMWVPSGPITRLELFLSEDARTSGRLPTAIGAKPKPVNLLGFLYRQCRSLPTGCDVDSHAVTDMKREAERLFEAKQARRLALSRLSFPEKVRMIIRNYSASLGGI